MSIFKRIRNIFLPSSAQVEAKLSKLADQLELIGDKHDDVATRLDTHIADITVRHEEHVSKLNSLRDKALAEADKAWQASYNLRNFLRGN